MKKIAISLLIVLFAIFAFFYAQIQKLETVITTTLAQHETTFQEFNVGIFPKPYISFDKVQHNQISIEKITGKFSLPSLVLGNAQLQELVAQNIKLSPKAQNSANVQVHFDDFSLNYITSDDIPFSTTTLITVELAKPLYGSNRIFNFRFLKGHITLRRESESLIQFDHVQFNQQDLGYIEIHADLTKPQKRAIAYIKPRCATNCLAVLKFDSYLQKSAVNFSGKNFPLTQLLALLNFPQTMTGTSDFNTQLAFTNSELIEGKFDFNARDGELLGLNLLDMAAQYLPINYNSDLTESRNMNTPYERFESNLSLENHLLKVDKISLKTSALLGEGSGAIDLDNVQCDVNLTLRSTDEKYKKLALPIRFFDSCYAPQYKLNINKNFRHQLKELIKEKLK